MFTPPLQVGLAQFGEGESQGALVQIIVTHMLSDGYTIVPLLADLAQLVAHAEAVATGEPVLPPLPPALPSALASLQRRVMRTVRRDDSFHDLVTLDPIGNRGRWNNRESATILATIPQDIVVAIQCVARDLALSDEIVMLAAIGTALARFKGEPTIAISMVVPQRDQPGESDMVGLFADVRILTIRTRDLSFAGAALHLQHVVKERLWRQPPVMMQGEFPFVNFEWTDFESRHGFSQLVHQKQGPEQLSNPLKVAVDQPELNTWRMRTAFDKAVYPQSDYERFFTLFEECLSAFIVDPLAPVWGPDVAGCRACSGRGGL